jgi:hypothetical protein
MGTGWVCICGDEERVLRGYTRKQPGLIPMTVEQREWCVENIVSVEGYDDRAEYASLPDSELASTVLSAWTDYCRDKGMM